MALDHVLEEKIKNIDGIVNGYKIKGLDENSILYSTINDVDNLIEDVINPFMDEFMTIEMAEIQRLREGYNGFFIFLNSLIKFKTITPEIEKYQKNIEKAEKEKKWDKVIDIGNLIINTNKAFLDTALVMADAYANIGDYKNACYCCGSVIQNLPADFEALYLMGKYLYQQDKYDEALEYIDKALKDVNSPKLPIAELLRWQILTKKKDNKDVSGNFLDIFKKSLTNQPSAYSNIMKSLSRSIVSVIGEDHNKDLTNYNLELLKKEIILKINKNEIYTHALETDLRTGLKTYNDLGKFVLKKVSERVNCIKELVEGSKTSTIKDNLLSIIEPFADVTFFEDLIDGSLGLAYYDKNKDRQVVKINNCALTDFILAHEIYHAFFHCETIEKIMFDDSFKDSCYSHSASKNLPENTLYSSSILDEMALAVQSYNSTAFIYYNLINEIVKLLQNKLPISEIIKSSKLMFREIEADLFGSLFLLPNNSDIDKIAFIMCNYINLSNNNDFNNGTINDPINIVRNSPDLSMVISDFTNLIMNRPKYVNIACYCRALLSIGFFYNKFMEKR